MPDDIFRLIGATTRDVRDVQREGKPAVAVVLSRDFDTPIDDLWDAVTNPKRLPRWFAPVRGDFTQGGRFQIEGNAAGTITRCEPPRALSLTWEYGGATSWVDVTLRKEGAGTRLRLEHIATPDSHWDQFGPGAGGVGWDLGLMGLARHLETPESARSPEADAAWMASEDAKRFLRMSSDDWGRAAVAAGEDEARARARAERTRAFYCGEGG